MAKQSIVENTRILVHEDLSRFKSPHEVIQKICALANDVAEKYEDLNLGQFSYDVFEDIIENGTLNIRGNYVANIKSEIKRLQINNPSMQQAFFGNIDHALLPLKNSLEIFMKYSGERMGYFSLQEKYKKASFLDHRFVLTKDNTERLKDEYCRIYIEDEKQKAAFESLEKVVDAYNNLLDNLKPMNAGIAHKFTQSTIRLEDYITLQNGKASVYKPALNYFLITA